MKRYFDPQLRCDAVKILPGEYAVSETFEVLVTVLGSCVAACIRDKRRGVGGMNHFMLPGGDDSMRAASYGVHAMELLINDLLKKGSRREDLTVKVFGGASVLGPMPTLNVGRSNGQFVRKFLRDEGLRVLAEDLFGEYPRKVYFFPRNGEVRVHYLRTLKNETIAQRERTYATALAQTRPDVELFSWPNESAS